MVLHDIHRMAQSVSARRNRKERSHVRMDVWEGSGIGHGMMYQPNGCKKYPFII